MDGGVVDETEQTVTVEMDHLSGIGVTFFVGPLQLLAMTTASAVESGTLYSTYGEGFKRALTLHGEVNVPIFYGLGFEGGASLILDVDDILSLGDTKRKYTGEGTGGFFTYGLNGHLAGSFGDVGASGSLQMTKSFTGKRGASRYNNDLSFDASLSLVSVSVPHGFLDAEFLTFNENGNFNPVDVQINLCPECNYKLDFQAGHGAVIKVLDSTVNIAEGEFNTNFEDVLRDLAENRCGQSRCQMSWSELIEQFLRFMVSGMVGLYSLGEKVGLLYDYTDYEHISPVDAADIGYGYINKIEGFGGGYDVNGDGVGDMVFPSDQTGGVPLRVLTTGDRSEQKRHFLEVTEITDGWSIEFDAANTPSDLNASSSTPSAGAVARVDFDAPALSLNSIHWLVTSTTTAPDAGRITLRLGDNPSFLGFDLEDVELDKVVSFALWKDKQHSDLSIEAEIDPDPARTDEPVTYTVTVQNKGPDRADDVKLTMKSISSLGLSLQQGDLSGSSLSCGRPDSIGDLVCNLGNIDSEQTATATLEFALKPTFPTGTPFTTAFAVTQRQRQGGSPLPREELVPSDNSTSTTARTVSDRNALIALYNATGGQNWRNNANWLSEEPLGDWEGVTTDDRGRVIQLHLVEQQLNGSLPFEMGDLTELKWLSIARNPNLTGAIPPEMAGLTKLEVLYLWENDLTGPVPTWLGDLIELQQLSLGHNRLSGPIPLELGRLTKLDTLYLAGNDLTGGIPYSLSDLPSLTRLFLYDNNLGGSIPSVLGNLEMLEYLHLRGNSITGCVPLGLINVLDSDIDQLGLTDCEASGRRNSAKELVLTPSIDIPGGLWSDGTTLWVSDWVDDRIYAYDLATRQRDSTKDFDTLEAAGNTGPQGIWSDGTTMWVADDGDAKLYAYDLATKARDSAKDFDTLEAAGNSHPVGIWSDDTTMWVADDGDAKLYAYDLATKARDSAKDFDTLEAAGNSHPVGIWSDGTTMWVADDGDAKLYAYDLATKARDSAKDFNSLEAARNFSPQGIWSDGTTMWVVNQSYSDPGLRKLFAYGLVTRERDSTKDIDLLGPEDNSDPQGIWSDGTTMWVADGFHRKIYAYTLATGGRDTSKDIDSLVAAGNTLPRGIWSDGTTMWVANYFDKLYAYDMATRERDSSKDLDIRGRSTGLWSDGTTMWVANDYDETISAYSLATGNRVAYREFDTLIIDDVLGIYSRQRGIWSDGLTMWVTHSGTGKIYAYNMTSGKRDTSKDFDSLEAVGNNSPVGIWSDGTTMWVADPSDEKIYAYNLATEGLPVCGTTTCVPFGWNPEKDFNLIPSLDYPEGIYSDGTTLWVLDAVDDKIYAYDLATQVRDAAKDFDTLIDAGNNSPSGSWSDGTTMWVTDEADDKIYAYNLTTKQRDSTLDFDTTVNRDFYPTRIWSDGTTMWVIEAEGIIYAYNLATGARDSSKDFGTALIDAGNIRPTGLWSDGTTMWVGDFADLKIYAYDLATRSRDSTEDFDKIADGTGLSAIWSDGTTMWVADSSALHAYDMVTKEPDPANDFNILIDTDPDAPYYIWTDGTTMWVSDPLDYKIYAYHLATMDRDETKDLDVSGAGFSSVPFGIWTNGTTMWAVAPTDDSIFAFDMATGERTDAKDFDVTGVADDFPAGIWSDGTTMWVADGALYAYNLATGQRDSAKDFNTLRDAGNTRPRGIWSDGTTMWVANLALGRMKIFAYDMVTKQWDSTKDFNTLDIYGNNRPLGITSDGTTMWVTQFDDYKIYAYNMPP